MPTKIHIGADHAGFELKKELIDFLQKKDYEVIDHGAFEYDENDDYPDFIFPVAKEVSLDQHSFGIVIGGSGQGEAIVANRIPGIRAVVFNGQYEPIDGREVPQEIITSRQHNDANVLSLGARFLSIEEAKEAVEMWLDTAFSGDERHIRRINKIDQIGM
ncbi:MAG TPA: RpiB/LacA/LacB family sugar-phosphate isomerase [Candidatus Paceibacterota bacterium]|nr:RpiB/LacA/LacB family sugar-phosphate isomerase [Candidatus Paceibacterota bacterium]HMP19080.1 RpiB/LacA/LacB family sugar-phosphate isomerase [Candidatus Paceibacterota bacterium]HMP85472.1 RpiB/LacA/LacB family sugar-phosphate isomerase [Candidatus Paceibacterota bacterium]